MASEKSPRTPLGPRSTETSTRSARQVCPDRRSSTITVASRMLSSRRRPSGASLARGPASRSMACGPRSGAAASPDPTCAAIAPLRSRTRCTTGRSTTTCVGSSWPCSQRAQAKACRHFRKARHRFAVRQRHADILGPQIQLLRAAVDAQAHA